MATPYASDWRMPKHFSETESQTAHVGTGGTVAPSTPPEGLVDTARRGGRRQNFQRRMRGQQRQTRRGF